MQFFTDFLFSNGEMAGVSTKERQKSFGQTDIKWIHYWLEDLLSGERSDVFVQLWTWTLLISWRHQLCHQLPASARWGSTNFGRQPSFCFVPVMPCLRCRHLAELDVHANSSLCVCACVNPDFLRAHIPLPLPPGLALPIPSFSLSLSSEISLPYPSDPMFWQLPKNYKYVQNDSHIRTLRGIMDYSSASRMNYANRKKRYW